MRVSRLILFFSLLLAVLAMRPALLAAEPEGTPPKAEASPSVSPTTPNQDQTGDKPSQHPEAFVPEVEHYFGTVSKGSKVSHEFIVQNKGDADLIINQVDPG